LLYYRNLVEALDRGIARVDWGAGDSGYKRVIGADEGPRIRDWLLLRPGVTAMFAPVAKRVWR
jgi:CelD/BcsL family acetyltransferase involved in cellulose biosynthesis